MPYKVKKQGDKYVVYKKDTGKRVGATAGNKEALRKYMAALHINAKENYNTNKTMKLKSLMSEDENQIAKNLTQAFNAGPAATRKYLDGPEGSSAEARALLLKPQASQDGSEGDDKVTVADVSGQAMGFKPTQNYIDLMQSVSWPLGSAKNLIDAINSGPTAKGIVTSKDLIIDGHHRWSGAIAIGADKAKIAGKSVNWPGEGTEQILAAAQLTIAAKLGPGKKTPSAGGGAATNILGQNAEAITKMIMANVNKQTDKNAPGALLNDKMIKDLVAGEASGAKVVYDWLGIEPFPSETKNKGYKLRLAIAKKVAENLSKLPQNPKAPDRPDMPQFDPKRGGPELKTVAGDLAAGKFNIAPPFIKEALLRRAIRKAVMQEVKRLKKK
jgi:hypothetical protein